MTLSTSTYPQSPKQLEIDPSTPGRLHLGIDDIDWVISGLHFRRAGKKPDGQKMHAIAFGGLNVRTIKPFDWLRFLRGWRFDFSEVHQDGQVYYNVVGIMKPILGRNPCVYLPDDRTIVLDEEAAIQKRLRREKPVVPAYLAGAEWEPFSRGILAVAINNRDEKFAKSYDLGRPDDALVLSVFKGVDRWILGIDDSNEIVLHAKAICNDKGAELIAQSVNSLLKMAQGAVEHPETVGPPNESLERALRMTRTLLTNTRLSRYGRSIDLRSEDFGTLAESAHSSRPSSSARRQAAAPAPSSTQTSKGGATLSKGTKR